MSHRDALFGPSQHERTANVLSRERRGGGDDHRDNRIDYPDHEAGQVERANATRATPVVFVHGLWLLPSSWDRWVTLFEEAGYVGVTPGWPDDPETVAEAREHPEVFAGKGIREIADYEEAIIRRLDRKPVIIGHSFRGLLTMILAGRGLAAASVAISPAGLGYPRIPIRGLPEVVASVSLLRQSDNQRANAPVRGIGLKAFDVHERVTFVEGDALHPALARTPAVFGCDQSVSGPSARR